MPLKVAELVAVLDMDAAGYQQGLSQSQTAMMQFGQRAQSANAEVVKSYQGLAAEAKKSGDAAKSAAQTANSARAASLDLVERLRRKEVDLTNARKSGDVERITRAEADLESIRRKSEIAAGREAIATDKATAAIERAVTAAKRADQAYANMGTSAARGMQQVEQAVQTSNPFAGLGAMGKSAGTDIAGNLAGAIPGPLRAAAGAAGPIGAAVMAIAAVGFIAGKTLADNVVKGFEIQQNAGKAQAKFGWTDAQLAEAGKAASATYVRAFGDSVNENRDAIGIAMQRGLIEPGATAAQMEPVVEKLNTIRDIMGVDIKDAAKGAGQMIKTGLAKDATEAFDLIVAAQHKGMNLDGEFMDTMQEYGTTYRKLGLDGATALGTIDQLVQGGARNVDQAADAVKEFGNKVLDFGNKDVKGAFEMLGLGVESTQAAFAKGGESAKNMSQTVIQKLAGVRDEAKRNEIGLALFGTKWEDVGAAINAIDFSTAAGRIGEVAGAADEAAKTMHGPATAMEEAKRSIEVSADSVRVKLAEAFGPQVSKAAEWISEHIDDITNGLTKVGAVAVAAAGSFEFVFGVLLKGAAMSQQGLARVAEAFLKVVEFALKGASHIPGPMGDMARSQLPVIEKQIQMAEGWKNGADAASEFANTLVKGGISLGQTAGQLWNTETRTKSATEAFNGLGIKVREVPDKKQIVIEDTSPDAMKRLEDLGIKVKTLPDGTVYIDAQDADAKAKIAELTKTETKQIIITTTQTAVSDELEQVNKTRVANGMAPLTPEEYGNGSAGAGVGGTGLSSTGQKITVKVAGAPSTPKPAATPATPSTPATPAAPSVPETVIQQTTEEKDKAAKEADKDAKKAEAEKKKADAAEKKAQKEKEKAEKDAEKAQSDLAKAQADLPAKQRALAAAEQRAREVAANPKASGSSRLSAENSVASAREALDKALAKITELQGKVESTADAAAKSGDTSSTPTTTTGSDGKPLTVTGAGNGGTLNVGTGSKPMQVEPANSAQGDGMRVFVTNMPAGGLGGGLKLSLFAAGGHVSGPGTGTSDDIPAMLSNGEFVVRASMASRFGGLLQAINDGRVQKFANGGPVNGLQPGAASLRQIIMQQFGVSEVGGYRPEDGYGEHSTGRALDVMVGNNKKQGDAVLSFVLQNAKTIGLKWAIWQQAMHYPDGRTSPMEDRGSPTQNHMDHVHVFLDELSNTASFVVDNAVAAGATGGDAVPSAGIETLTASSTKQQIAAAAIAEGRKRGLTDVQIRAVLATMLTENHEFDPKTSGGVQGSAGEVIGLFQQDKSYGSVEDRQDPAKAIKGFYDRLGETTGDDIYKRITGVQQHGGAYQGTGGDQSYMDLIQGKADEADKLFTQAAATLGTGTGAGGTLLKTTGSGATPTTGSGGTQNVYVTGGKLDSVGSGTGNTGSQFKFSLFSSGGHVSGPGSGTSDSIPAMLSNGEYVINAKSARANYPLVEAINQAGGVLRLAGGGPVIPKVEAPKVAPQIGGMSLMPGGALPLTGAAPTVTGGGVPAVGVDPIAALTGGGLGKQQGVGGTSTPQEYAVQRLLQYGGDMAKVLIQAGKEIALPSGLDSQQAQNVLGLIKGVGNGIQASHEKNESTSTSKTDQGKTTNITNNHTWNVSSADEAYRNLKRDEGIKSLTYDGSLA